MKYNLVQALPILQNTPTVVRLLALELHQNWTGANEGGDTWSFYDVLGHLLHCEEDDWIPRLNIILSQGSNKKFAKFDRLGHIEKSKGLTLDDLLLRFESRRAENIDILRKYSLTNEQMFMQGIHPEFGSVTVSELLSAWVVHDLNHISQMCRVLAHQYTEAVGPWKEYMPILNKK